MSLIGISGLKGSGKSTAASYLTQNNFVELTFSKHLKLLVKMLFQIEDKYLYDNEYKEQIIPELNVSCRQLLQVIGTELFRNTLMKCLPNLNISYKSIWIHNTINEAKQLLSEGKNVVISDVRFPDEFKSIKDLNGKVYLIKRNEVLNTDKHESESYVLFDEIIENNESVDKLYEKLRKVVIKEK